MLGLADGLTEGEVESLGTGAGAGAISVGAGAGACVGTGASVVAGAGESVGITGITGISGITVGATVGSGAGAALSIGTGSPGINSAAIVRANWAINKSATKPIKAFRTRTPRSPSITEKDNFPLEN